jgi:UDP-glucose 4-epimerase
MVTGATGFVGQYLVKSLLNQGHEVVCAVRQDSKITYPRVENRICDFHNRADLSPLVRDVDIIYHLAGCVFSQNSNELFRVNRDGTARLYRATKDSPVKLFVFLSSIAAVGPSEVKLTENNKPKPISIYGKSKLAAELALSRLAPTVNKKTVVVRCPLIYGNGMNAESRIFALANRICDGSFKIVGRGDNVISFLYVNSLIDFLLSIQRLEMNNNFEIFQLADEKFTLKKLVNLISEIVNTSITNRHISKRLALFVATFVDFFNKVFLCKRNCIPLKVQFSEISGNWVIDILKARRYGYVSRHDSLQVFESVIRSYYLSLGKDVTGKQ